MNPKGTPENLRPRWKPGESGNPSGINQYTYRREAEAQLEAMLKEKAEGRTRSEQIIDRLIADAARGKPYALKLVLDRILPVVTQHEVAFPGSVGVGTLLDRLAALRARKRANGGAAGVEPSRGNGGDGAAA